MSEKRPRSQYAEMLSSARARKKHAGMILSAAETFQLMSTTGNEAMRKDLQLLLDEKLGKLDAEPDAWGVMKTLVGLESDTTLEGLMTYSLARSKDQLRDMTREVERMPEDSQPAPNQNRKRKRRRDRDL